jgi:glucose-6-phosphate 1-dehydrogenase
MTGRRAAFIMLSVPDPAQVLVLFGATGDLAARKILPALYNLALDGRLPEQFAVLGYARSGGDDEGFRDRARHAVGQFSRRRLDDARWQRFAEALFYLPGSFDTPGCFAGLRERLAQIKAGWHSQCACLYYCATPPGTFTLIARRLGEEGLQCGDARIVLEKPVGRDLASARALDRDVSGVFGEEQVFRIDHYLGKDAVQNILVFRFANPLIERIWNGEAIEHVQVTVAESIGIEGRGGYYDTAGAMRDMVQNHLLQVLAFLAMERPAQLGGAAARDAKSALFGAVRPFDPGEVIRGQYQWGVVEGQQVCGYRDEDGVAAGSGTETYAAVRAWIGNDRWRGVPFVLRTGKRLAHQVTEVVVELRDAEAGHLFAGLVAGVPCNSITIRLQPDPGITIGFREKEPGTGLAVRTVPMQFSYGAAFTGVEQPEAYEHLLADALAGEEALFLREDAVERAWEIAAPAIEAPGALHPYPAGTWGPAAADQLISPHRWHLR